MAVTILIFWLPTTILLTLTEPFTVPSNGYFACWVLCPNRTRPPRDLPRDLRLEISRNAHRASRPDGCFDANTSILLLHSCVSGPLRFLEPPLSHSPETSVGSVHGIAPSWCLTLELLFPPAPPSTSHAKVGLVAASAAAYSAVKGKDLAFAEHLRGQHLGRVFDEHKPSVRQLNAFQHTTIDEGQQVRHVTGLSRDRLDRCTQMHPCFDDDSLTGTSALRSNETGSVTCSNQLITQAPKSSPTDPTCSQLTQ